MKRQTAQQRGKMMRGARMPQAVESNPAAAPTPYEVERIAQRRNPVIRNLQITQAYHDLSQAISARLGPCANWCTFATWASKQAGQTIRKEDLSRALAQHLAISRVTTRAVAEVARSARPNATARARDTTVQQLWLALNPIASVERVSNAVARGNQMVFAEIGQLFARFVSLCLADSAPDPDHLGRFYAQLRQGEPPHGQRYLQQAFGRYYAAQFEGDEKAKAEMILLANLEIGLHEQTRLQPQIQAAMEASSEATSLDSEPMMEMTHRLLGAVYSSPAQSARALLAMQRRRERGLPTPLDLALLHLLDVARRHMRRFLTAHLMTLWIPPDLSLRLGRDVPAAFPAVLQRITNPDLRALLKQIDRTPDSVSGSGARDWAALPDRLHFISDLFRCYHASPDVRLQPFTEAQVMALRAGKRPDGRL